MLGEEISIERIGTDGDMEAAALKFKELDGKVDAFGVGGADLGTLVDGKWYRLYSVEKMVRFINSVCSAATPFTVWLPMIARCDMRTRRPPVSSMMDRRAARSQSCRKRMRTWSRKRRLIS